MKNRRNLTPPEGGATDGVHATRRGGARHEVSARVTIKAASGQTYEGWALNVSRGGVRAIFEEKVELGAEFEVTLVGITMRPGALAGPPAPLPSTTPSASEASGTAASAPQMGRVVWVQEEPDGVVIGIEFLVIESLPKT